MNQETGAGATSELSQHIQAVATLIRDRQYERALGMARELLAAYPDSAQLRTVLGDVYAARRMWPEAVEWYHDAVERGDSSAQAKLAQAHAQLSSPAPAVTPRTPRASQVERERTRLWITLASAGAVVVIVAVIASVGLLSRPPAKPLATEEMPLGPPPGPSPSGPTVAVPGSLSSARPAPSPASEQPPESETPATSVAEPAQPGGARILSQPVPVIPPATPTSPVNTGPRTQRDLALESAIGSLTWPDGTTMYEGVAAAMDPVTGYAMITFEVPRSLRSSNLYDVVVRQSYPVAAAVVNTDPGVQSMTLRGILDPSGSRRQRHAVVAYRGNTSRESILYWLRRDATPSDQDIWTKVFAGTWWNPDIPRTGYR